ncbi:hypothetical protein [Dactylosporangium sp. CA-139066]|uniref:hypothetical protein n=1 Tax=Dactylosporangium sp. CA-139066 TaxID=3239930 RepID=UPI003D91D6D0
MAELDHPLWCVDVACTADRPTFNGHPIGAHRSSAQRVGLTELRLRQAPNERVPSVEVRRGDVVLVLPIGEAQSLSPGADDLFRAAGVGL